MRCFNYLPMLLFALFLTLKLTSGQVCISSNDKDLDLIQTFNESLTWPKNEQYSDKTFLLYRHESSVTIMTRYRECTASINCHCSIHIRTEEGNTVNFAYVDFCSRKLEPNGQSGEYEFKTWDGRSIEVMQCSDHTATLNRGGFSCLKIDAFNYSISTSLSKNNVNVQFTFVEQDDDEHELAQVSVTPDLEESRLETTGLCGDYSNTIQIEDSQNGYEIWEMSELNFQWDFDITSVQDYECYVNNSIIHFIGFDNVKIDRFDKTIEANKHYILFQDDDILRVSAKYRPCPASDWERCSCGLFIQARENIYNHYAFVDACDANEDVNMNFKYYEPRITKDALKTGHFGAIDCSYLIDDENDKDEWNKVPTSWNQFKCARLTNKNSCETYVIEANAQGKSIKVKVNMKCGNEYMSFVSIASSKVPTNYGGLCGKPGLNCAFTDKPNKCVRNSAELTNYWNIEERNSPWHLDLSSFVDHECNLYNYERSFTRLNNMEAYKVKSFSSISSPLILYDHNQEVMVYAQFKPCTKTTKLLYCACSFYLRVNNKDPEIVFIDFCLSEEYNNNSPIYELEHFKNSSDYFASSLNCTTELNDATSEAEWQSVPVKFGFFKCAKLKSPCEQYLIQTVNTPYNIQVQVDATCRDEINDPLSQIIIKSALKGENATRGVCGYWHQSNSLNSRELGYSRLETEQTSIDELIKTYNLEFYETRGLLPEKSNVYQIHSKPPTIVPSTDKTKACSMQNDPHMRSFMGTKFEFQFEGNYVLYITNRLTLVGHFKSCGGYAKCILGITAYVNARGNNEPKIEKKLKYFEPTTNAFVATYFDNCLVNTTNPNHLINDFHDDDQWYRTFLNGRNTRHENIDCYAIKNDMLTTTYYMIKFEEQQDVKSRQSHTLVRVQKFDGENWIHNITIYPWINGYGYDPDKAIHGETINGGICGLTQCIPEISSNCNEFWKKDGSLAKSVTFQQCVGDGITYSKCADQDFANKWAFTAVSGTSWNGRDSLNEDKNIPLFDKISQMNNNRLENETTIDTQICYTSIDISNLPLNDELENLRDSFISQCIMDLEMTHDPSWANVHAKSMRKSIIDFILSQSDHFDDEDDLVKQEVLDLYGITCPNDCSNRGHCFKNPKCTFGESCDHLLICDCEWPHGSSDCSVNVNAPPEFELLNYVFDSKNLQNISLVGVGPRFSDNNTLYFAIEIVGSNSSKVLGEVSQVQDQFFQITYPFGYIPEIHQNVITLKVGVSYNDNMNNAYWQSITIYDSTCRIYEDQVLKPELKPGTCVAPVSGMCSKPRYGVCLEPHACSGAFDLALLVQSSSHSSENEYVAMKDALAEIIGQYRIEQNQVHLGMMLVSQIMRTYASASARDQRSRRGTVDKLQDLPYVPYQFSNLADALSKASTEIFTQNSARAYKVPKVAVLVNDAKTNPAQSLSVLSAAVGELKKNGVTVFAVGFGSNVSTHELAAIASAPENVFQFERREEIYERMGELTSAVCSTHVVIEPQVDEQTSLGTFDVRYFKTDVRKFRNDIVELRVEEMSGRVGVYASIEATNPTQQTSDFLARSSSTKVEKKVSKGSMSYYFFLGDFEEFIYFTIVSYNQLAQVEIRVDLL